MKKTGSENKSTASDVSCTTSFCKVELTSAERHDVLLNVDSITELSREKTQNFTFNRCSTCLCRLAFKKPKLIRGLAFETGPRNANEFLLSKTAYYQKMMS